MIYLLSSCLSLVLCSLTDHFSHSSCLRPSILMRIYPRSAIRYVRSRLRVLLLGIHHRSLRSILERKMVQPDPTMDKPRSAADIATDAPGEPKDAVDGGGRRRRDVDEGTEGGTVLPTHSVSRRASLAERRRWMQQDAEPTQTRSTEGRDVMDMGSTTGQLVRDTATRSTSRGAISNQPMQHAPSKKTPLLQDKHNSPRNISSSRVSGAGDLLVKATTPAQEDFGPPSSAIDARHSWQNSQKMSSSQISRYGGNRAVNPDTSVADKSRTSSAKCDTRNRNSLLQTALQDHAGPGEIPTRPARGRRPPTPYHPPSDVALTEIPESSVGETEETAHRDVSSCPGDSSTIWLILVLSFLRDPHVGRRSRSSHNHEDDIRLPFHRRCFCRRNNRNTTCPNSKSSLGRRTRPSRKHLCQRGIASYQVRIPRAWRHPRSQQTTRRSRRCRRILET